MSEQNWQQINAATWILGIEREMEVLTEASDRIEHYALEARKSGATWVEIGNALGISAQAAHKRYGRI